MKTQQTKQDANSLKYRQPPKPTFARQTNKNKIKKESNINVLNKTITNKPPIGVTHN
jgi:hypothetical protein